jgi:hypothetical protein
MDDPYDILDDYQEDFQREMDMLQKGFDGYDVVGHGPLDMIENQIIQNPDRDPLREQIEALESFTEQQLIQDFNYVPESQLPESPYNPTSVKPDPLSETPPGLLDKPDSRQAPYNPFKYTPARKAGGSHRSRGAFQFSKGMSFRPFKSRYCQDKQESVTEYECEESGCEKLIEVMYYGKVCKDWWDWHLHGVKYNARNGTVGTWREWDILREYGGEEFRAMVEEQDRKEREKQERSRQLSEDGLGDWWDIEKGPWEEGEE